MHHATKLLQLLYQFFFFNFFTFFCLLLHTFWIQTSEFIKVYKHLERSKHIVDARTDDSTKLGSCQSFHELINKPKSLWLIERKKKPKVCLCVLSAVSLCTDFNGNLNTTSIVNQ